MDEAGKNYLNPFWQDFGTILIGHAVITLELTRSSVRIVFFGVDGCERRM
jgi:hypothetical protein